MDEGSDRHMISRERERDLHLYTTTCIYDKDAVVVYTTVFMSKYWEGIRVVGSVDLGGDY
jgi:hypothetical protein